MLFDRNLLACVPRDRSGLPPHEALDAIVITDLYTLRQCENLNCCQDIWVGPRQMAAYNENPDGFWVLCYMCAARAARGLSGEAFDPDSDVRDLGGGSTIEGRPRIT